MENRSTKRLGAVLYTDFELLDLYGPLEMFGAVPGLFDIVTVAAQPGPIASTPGPQTVAEFSFDDCPPLDLLLLPGGLGTLQALEDESLLHFLRERSRSASHTMSVCSGSAILARAGLLDGRRATSNKQLFWVATSQSDKVQWVEQARWVEDGTFVTSSGVSAGTDMALAVIERLCGTQMAEQIAALTEYQWHRAADRDPFVEYLNAMDADTFLSVYT